MIKRTHDKQIYLNEDRYDSPKEIFKILSRLAAEENVIRKGSTVCDFGCATGEFLYFLHGKFPQAKCVGFDAVPDLLERARKKVPGVEFRLGSVLDEGLLPKASVDVAFMLGVHSLFDEFETVFSNLQRWTTPGGCIYIFGLFNPYPVDVWIKYRLPDDPIPGHLEPGWNLFSKTSVSRYLDRTLGQGRYIFHPFEMPFDLPKHPNDPVRTWTFMDGEKRRQFVNGLSLICNLEILELRP